MEIVCNKTLKCKIAENVSLIRVVKGRKIEQNDQNRKRF